MTSPWLDIFEITPIVAALAEALLFLDPENLALI